MKIRRAEGLPIDAVSGTGRVLVCRKRDSEDSRFLVRERIFQ